MKSEILKALVVSTAHITKEDQQRLEVGDFPVSMAADDYGYWLWAKVSVLDIYNYGFSKHLVKLLTFAVDQGCDYLRLDCDGPDYDHLETFEW